VLVLDLARVLLAGIGGITGAYQLALIRKSPTPGQRLRLAGIAVALAVLSASRLQNIGGPVTWQFFAGAVAIALLAWGSLLFRREIPAQRRHTPDPHGPPARPAG
jgi:uncharacterized protein YaaW (UPF0174 family)